ncbi:hypothetical protein MMC20_001544 [Loxospora ochrophaea]|nr:hypothetical protein [Loxospora ochrophaea]
MSSPRMNLSGLGGFLRDPVSPTERDGHLFSPLIATRNRPFHEYETPTKQHPSSINGASSPPTSESEFRHAASQLPSMAGTSGAGTPTSEVGEQQWSAAVGHAGTGKSGRVIERLMGDKDKLQRQLNLATLRLEEELKRSESREAALENLRATNENLVTMHDSNKNTLIRRDRKIEELKAELDAERLRREKAEKETRETTAERDEAVAKCTHELAEEKLKAKKATNQYEVLSGSWKSLDEGYQRKTQKLQKDVEQLNVKRDGDQKKLAGLEVVAEQLNQEIEKTTKAREKLVQEFAAYKKLQDESLRGIVEKAQENDNINEKTLEEMQRVLGRMKWAINVKQDVASAG